jgi:dihydroorotate dehydrogenase
VALYPLLRPLAFALDAERAHRATIAALKLLPAGRPAAPDPILSIAVAGLEFPNPVGLAAGFDKDAEIFRQMLGFGFGFVEVGTLTPLPQGGNPRSRLFRLAADRAVINRMGFNNDGQSAALGRLLARRRGGPSTPLGMGLVGVNIGANKDNAGGNAAIADYSAGVAAMTGVADYLTVNISSPNTPGLRDLQDEGALDALLAAVTEARGAGPPIFLKVAPDLEPAQIDAIARTAIARRIDALIVGNTTLSRPGSLRERDSAREAGGLSGKPLFKLSTRMLAETFVRAENAFPLIGVGGIDSGSTAIAKIKAGATLLQLYSALVYRGIGVVAEIKADLTAALRRGHRNSLASMVGNDAAAITAESWPG